MKKSIGLSLFLALCSFSNLVAHHHDSNPPCNHESLQDARNGAKK